MKRSRLWTNIWALACNLCVVYLCYTLCRLLFVWVNRPLYAGHLDLAYAGELFRAGLIFDTTAILYINTLFILLFLFPLHWKEKPGFYRVVRWLYTGINLLFLSTNLVDCVYFPLTGRRTTMSVFDEFAHETGRNLGSVFLHETVTHGYLLVCLLLLGCLLFKAFRMPVLPVTRKVPYYLVQTLALLAVAPFVVFGMRGGMTTATRPITISNANQYVRRPLDAGVVLNTPFSLFRTLGKRSFVVLDYMSEEEAVRLYSPLHQPNDTLQTRPLNVVVFILESFSRQYVGPRYTPFLDSLQQQGLSFRYAYSNGRKSIDGMPSILSSIPSFVEPFFLTPASLNDLSGLAGELGRHKGYHTSFFHGAMNGSMGFEAFARASGFDSYWGRTEYNQDPHYGGDQDFDGTWAIWDEEFLQFFCDRLSEFPEPFASSVFTATSHTPFALPERYAGLFPEGPAPLFRCIAYTDYALRRFFEKARKQPWFCNTLFVLTADHTSGNCEPVYVTDLGEYAVPILFYAPGLPELQGYDEAKVVNQIDILPTVLGLLGYERPYVAFGQDILHTPAEEKFAVNYLPATGIYQFVQGDYLLQFDGKQSTRAYAFRRDSLLQENCLATMPAETRQSMEDRLKSIIQQYMQRMNTNQLVVPQETSR
ncbi:MAG: LTA synthase family protein [Parabacteroides sp.]